MDGKSKAWHIGKLCDSNCDDHIGLGRTGPYVCQLQPASATVLIF